MTRSRRLRRVEPEDVYVNALEHYEPGYLECREMAHVWKISSPFRLVDTTIEDRQPRGGHATFAERKLTCGRCGMVRSDAFSITDRRGHTALHKIGSSYEQPDGYAITGIGNTAGLRDLLYGVAFDQQQKRSTGRGKRKAG